MAVGERPVRGPASPLQLAARQRVRSCAVALLRQGLVARPTGAEVPALKQAGPCVSVTGIAILALSERDGRPAFVPRTTGRRQEMAGTAGASNPHVTSRIPTSSQVEKPTTRTLSRWRHGFKSRWDYAGQRTRPGATRASGPALAPRRTPDRHRSSSGGRSSPRRPTPEPSAAAPLSIRAFGRKGCSGRRLWRGSARR